MLRLLQRTFSLIENVNWLSFFFSFDNPVADKKAEVTRRHALSRACAKQTLHMSDHDPLGGITDIAGLQLHGF